MILGWEFFSSGSFRTAWDALKHKLWKVFHSHFRKPGVGRAGFSRKLIVLERTVLRVLLRAVEPWPFTQTVAAWINALHRHMVACLVRLPKNVGEPAADYMKRRARFAASIIETPWSSQWAKNVCSWDAHLKRGWERQKLFYQWKVPPGLASSSFSWAAALRNYHDAAWLADRRDQHSRTGLRSIPAGVAIRWEQGVDKAKKFVQ